MARYWLQKTPNRPGRLLVKRISVWSAMLIIGSMLVAGSSSAAVLTFWQDDILKFGFLFNTADTNNLTGSASAPALPYGLTTDLFVLPLSAPGCNPYKGVTWEAEPSYTSPPSLVGLPPSAQGVYFEGWASEMWIGATASNLGLADGSTFDSFELAVTNWNNQVWNFSAFIYDIDVSTLYESSPPAALVPRPIPTSPGGSSRLVLSWPAGYTVAASDLFGVHVTLPSGGVDKAHFEVNPVPEPGTLILLGSGMIGLAGWGRRRRLRR